MTIRRETMAVAVADAAASPGPALLRRSVGATSIGAVAMLVLAACSGARPTLSAELISTRPVETTSAAGPTTSAPAVGMPIDNPVGVVASGGRVGPHAGLGRPVAVIGDSIGAQSSPAISQEFANAGWGHVVIDAQPSRRIPQDKVTVAPYSGIAAVKKMRAAGFDPVTWVIELGTNDIMNTGDDPVVLAALVTNMLDTIGPGHDIVWITVYNGVEPKAARTFNQILQRFDTARADVVLGRWADIADGKGLVSDDHIHLTPAGERAFASELVQAANRLVPNDAPAEPRLPR